MLITPVLLWQLLLVPLTDDDLIRRPDAVQVRMGMLKVGMKEAEAKMILGIGVRQPEFAFSTNRYHSYSGEFNVVSFYSLGSRQTLQIEIKPEDKGLWSATLYGAGPKGVVQFPADLSRVRLKWPEPESSSRTQPRGSDR